MILRQCWVILRGLVMNQNKWLLKPSASVQRAVGKNKSAHKKIAILTQ
jgi:hypothetical protein